MNWLWHGNCAKTVVKSHNIHHIFTGGARQAASGKWPLRRKGQGGFERNGGGAIVVAMVGVEVVEVAMVAKQHTRKTTPARKCVKFAIWVHNRCNTRAYKLKLFAH